MSLESRSPKYPPPLEFCEPKWLRPGSWIRVEHEEVLGRAAAADDQVVPEIPGRGHARDGLEGPADVLESPGELADLHPGQAEEARGRGLRSLRLLGRDRDLAAQDLEAGADRDLAGRTESPDAGDDGEITVLLDQALVIAGGNAGQDIGSVLAGDRGPGRIEQGDAGPRRGGRVVSRSVTRPRSVKSARTARRKSRTDGGAEAATRTRKREPDEGIDPAALRCTASEYIRDRPLKQYPRYIGNR